MEAWWPGGTSYLWVGLCGACVGSFVNVAVYRLPRGASVVRPGSHCPACRHRLGWTELVPVLSYGWLRGRCAHCRVRIARSYPVVEATAAVLFLVLFYRFGWSLVGLRYVVLAMLLLTAAEVDRRHGVIPNRLVVTGIVAGLVLAGGLGTLVQGGGAALASAGLLGGLRVGSAWLTGRPGIGMGDVKLAVVLGLFLGWETLWVLYLAAVLGGTWGLVGLCTGRMHGATRLPFAPFMAAGAGLDVFWISPDLLLGMV